MALNFAGRKNNGSKHPERDLALKKIRVEQGDERNTAWRALSNEQKLADLDTRLGSGVGAKRQRTRIASFVALEKIPVKRASATTIPAMGEAVVKKKAKERRDEQPNRTSRRN